MKVYVIFGPGSVSLAKYAAAGGSLPSSGRCAAHDEDPPTRLVGIEALSPAAVDVVLHPPTQPRRHDAEIGGHLGAGQVAGPGQLIGRWRNSSG
jgi:hypothetical protein